MVSRLETHQHWGWKESHGNCCHYKVLFALLSETGLRIGEAHGLKLDEHLSGDFSTIRVRQSVWRGSVQAPKTDNAAREIDITSFLAALLKASVGGRTSGFLFQSESGRPLTQRNVLRDGLGKTNQQVAMMKQDESLSPSFFNFRSHFAAIHCD